ncbi:hypothetical protein [Streptomyces zaomyceticus]|uniref:hypothetical protein n=1 Tax=Streptomyces zaomyceticus TaxID=68286 RepID=UPI0016736AD0|nr:hypothetical protein [Streptomyces zaomyceticus]GHG05175.1 hypothetical protein GCM10018791_16930 [Streptomyces zaomyceticus]
MRTLWACGLVLSMIGLAGCTGAAQDSKGEPQTPKPSPVMIAISGRVQVLLSTDGTGPGTGEPCTPPQGAKAQAGMAVRVTDGSGTALGAQKLAAGRTTGSALKGCALDFSFKVSGASEHYKLIIGEFPPMTYTREDIRRGLSFYETEQGTLAEQ